MIAQTLHHCRRVGVDEDTRRHLWRKLNRTPYRWLRRHCERICEYSGKPGHDIALLFPRRPFWRRMDLIFWLAIVAALTGAGALLYFWLPR